MTQNLAILMIVVIALILFVIVFCAMMLDFKLLKIIGLLEAINKKLKPKC